MAIKINFLFAFFQERHNNLNNRKLTVMPHTFRNMAGKSKQIVCKTKRRTCINNIPKKWDHCETSIIVVWPRKCTYPV